MWPQSVQILLHNSKNYIHWLGYKYPQPAFKIHPMVIHHAAGVLHPVDRLVLTAKAPTDASTVPSSTRAALADPHWRRTMQEYATLLDNRTWDLVPRPTGTNVVSS